MVTMLFAIANGATAADFPLLEAVKNQDQQQVGTLLTQHVDVNVRSNDGSTALLWAAHWGDVKTTDLLLRAGADPNAANDFRMTPLSQACVNGSAALVELLLKAGANPNTSIATGETPLMTCSKTGSADAVQALIAHDAAINAKEPVQNQTALMWAAAERHPGVVKMLIDAKADLQARTKRGFTALHFAAREGDRESTRLLLAAGVSVNILAQPDALAKGKVWRRRGGRTCSRRCCGDSGCRGSRWHRSDCARWWEECCRRRLHPTAGRYGQRSGRTGALPPRSRSGPQRCRCGFYAPALGSGHMGERHLQSGVWL